jgi:Kelch motif.
MKITNIYILLSIISIFCLSSCLDDPDLPNGSINSKAPEIETIRIDTFTATSVTISANVIRENGDPITERGIYWSKTSPLDIKNATRVPTEGGKGIFTVTLSDLTNNETYYIKPYARNKKGISLGEERSATTNTGLGTVITLDAKNVKATSAIIGGNIEKRGEGDVLEKGFYLSLTETFVECDTIISTTTTDSFDFTLTDLVTDTTYYFRAFVRNKFGLFPLGEVKSFKTQTGLAIIENLKSLEVGLNTAMIEAEIKDEGDASITERGFCWTKEGTVPTVDNYSIISGSGTGVFSGTLTSLIPGTKYVVRAYSINSHGVSYSNMLEFTTKSDIPTVATATVTNIINGTARVGGEVLYEGGTAIKAAGICWSTEPNPTIDNDSIVLTTTKTAFSGTINGLVGGKTYYIRAFVQNEGDYTTYGGTVQITTPSIYSLMTALNEDLIQGSPVYFQIGGVGYVLGGDSGSGPGSTDKMWRYDPNVNNWNARLSFPVSGTYGQAAASVNNDVYLLGGKSGTDGTISDKLHKYSASNNTWSEVVVSSSTKPSPVYYSAGCALGNNLYYIGGTDGTSVISDVWAYSGNTWTKKTSLPYSISKGIALVVNNTIYAGLGYFNAANDNMNPRMWSSSNNGDTWTEIEESIPSSTGHIRGSVVFDNDIYVIDGTGTIYKFSTSSREWSKKSKLSVLNNEIHCMYELNGVIYIGLGSSGSAFISYNPHWDN